MRTTTPRAQPTRITGVIPTLGSFMPGLDRKGEGGYVVGPGSIVQGTTYEVADWTTLTSTPEAGSPATKVGAGKVSSSMIDKRSEVLG